MEQLELLLHRGALRASGKHRVEVDHVDGTPQLGQHGHAVARDQAHAPGGDGQVGVSGSTFQGIGKQRGDHGVALAHRHLEAGGCQKQRVLAQAGRGVKGDGRGLALDAGRLHEQLASQTVMPDARQQLAEVGRKLHAVARKRQPPVNAPQLKAAGQLQLANLFRHAALAFPNPALR